MPSPAYHFENFELDVGRYELRRNGHVLKLEKIPMELLILLISKNGDLVSREEIIEKIWGQDVFVETEHSINTAVRKIRQTLGDEPNQSRFVQTVVGKGYRFVASLNGKARTEISGEASAATVSVAAPDATIASSTQESLGELTPSVMAASASGTRRLWYWLIPSMVAAGVLFAWGAASKSRQLSSMPARALTQITFDEGLQFGSSWSPDGQFLAYSSDRGGKFDIWVQPLRGGGPVQVTRGAGDRWAPNWSPDGKSIAYRSEENDGGIFVVPAFGGDGLERKIASFGYYPRWSPDGTKMLFQSTDYTGLSQNRFFVAGSDGTAPRQILPELTSQMIALSGGWHPDSKRISFLVCDPSSYDFWTVPAGGGPAIKSEMSPEVLRQRSEVGLDSTVPEFRSDFFFAWAPSGKGVYLEQTFRGTKNIWRMNVDPQTLRAQSFERVTTGAGSDTELALSEDGKKLAFTSETSHVQAWMFPFDAGSGQLKGPGKPVTPPGRAAWEFSLSRDGKNLAYKSARRGQWELWKTSLADQHESLIGGDIYLRNFPQWSPDGSRLAYFRNGPNGQRELMVWSSLSGEERPITEAKKTEDYPYDWSPDGKTLLITRLNPDNHRGEIWTVGTSGDSTARKVAADPDYDLWQAHFSPNGQWIAFMAIKDDRQKSTIYVMPAAGGKWIPITDGTQWDDKPHWSPDGKTIYFVSGRHGFYNVFGIRFDPARVEPLRSPFPVTAFKSPNLMIPREIMAVELGVAPDRLVVTVEQLSGNIWVLDQAER